MKLACLFLLSVLLSLSGQGQEISFDTSYYTPPQVVRESLLTADPEQNKQRLKNGRRSTSRRDLFRQFRETQAWYVSAEGGIRSDVSQLSSSLDQWVSSPTQTKAVWAGLAGYVYRNAWAIETGYTKAPTHLTISIANGAYEPLVYNYQNDGHGIPLRIKRRIGLGKRAANGTGFWLTGGVWLVPNGDGQAGNFKLIGYQYRGRLRTDTIRINNVTTTTKRITSIAELGIEYTTRLASTIELSFYARKYWGLGPALQANLEYTINNRSGQYATATADGTGWASGITLRYIYGKQQEVKKTF